MGAEQAGGALSRGRNEKLQGGFMKISGVLIAFFVALSPCAFAQDKAAPDKPLPLDDRPLQKPLDDKAAQEKAKAEREEQRRAAAEKKALDYKLYKEELFKQCVIRPVMTDDEIDACKKAYRA
jgi:hypothetical protein